MENKEIISAQVVFPDGRTLDEVMAELRSKVESMSAEATAEEEGTA